MSNVVKKKLKVKGMHCTSCAMNIDMDLEELKGIRSAKTSYARQEIEIEFEEKNVDLEKIIQQIQQTGYTAELTS